MTRPHWKKIAMALKARMESDGYTVTLTWNGANIEHQGFVVKGNKIGVNTSHGIWIDSAGTGNSGNPPPKPWWRWPWITRCAGIDRVDKD